MSAVRPAANPATIVIFGASGDLTHRKLIPALHSLACEGLLHPATRILGVARSHLSTGDLVASLFDGVEAYARLDPHVCDLWPGFVQRISYLAGDYDDPETYHRLASLLDAGSVEAMPSNHLFYLAIPPVLSPAVIRHLGQAGLNRSNRGWVRIIIEKPFGHDLPSARRLNEDVHAVFGEDQIYRIDHYLGKETVQNLLVFRFGNSIFEPLWNRNYIDHVQITMAEDEGVGHRAGYYDQAGVLRDMFQNHILQLLSLTAMEAPAVVDAKALRDEKVKVLQAIRRAPVPEGVWGQYEGYRKEPGVAVASRTPTYVALKLYVDNWRWQGVPFYIRSGKRLASKLTQIVLEFKQVPHLLFPESSRLENNRIELYIQPNEGVHLSFATKVPGAGMRAEPVDMQFHYGDRFGANALPEAYERLLLDALQGDASLFARSDEIELAWSLVDEMERAVTPDIYAAGGQGPEAADTFIARDDRRWLPIQVDPPVSSSPDR